MQCSTKIAIATLAWLLAATCGAWAQDTLRAAAVVNDEIVSMLDVVQRMKLAILSTGLKDTPELRQRMLSQVVRGLIDERLQAQEAERLSIVIPDQQIESAIDDIAQQNKMPRERFMQVLESKGVIIDVFFDQIRAQLTWQTLLARRIGPSAQISDEEVDDVVTRVRSSQGTTLRRISEIFLSVDNPNQDEEVGRNANRIFDQLRANVEFGPLARQFSESATAARGGEVGWVQKGQLAEELDTVLEAMEPGQVSRPIRTLSGYHIVWLRDVRRSNLGDVKLDLKQILFALPPAATPAQRDEAMARAGAIRTEVTACEAVEGLAESVGSKASSNLGRVTLADLPPTLRDAVGSLSKGQVSEPVVVPAGVSLLVVCDRQDGGIDRERIRQRLQDERVNILARRFMRDLRRDANVDVRI